MPKPKINRCAMKRWDACIEFICLGRNNALQVGCRYYTRGASRLNKGACSDFEVWPTFGNAGVARACRCREAQDEALGLPLAEKVEELEADLVRKDVDYGIIIDKLEDELDRVKADNEVLEELTMGRV